MVAQRVDPRGASGLGFPTPAAGELSSKLPKRELYRALYKESIIGLLKRGY